MKNSRWITGNVGAALLVGMAALTANAAVPIAWHTAWNDALFTEAEKEHRFVILDLHAVWCHWCHVMDQTTYADSAVARLIGTHYLAVSVDADSDPSLSSRYGNWGWPATIVLAADGTEIVKRRGYIPPAQMASLLQAIIDDPSPGPSVQPEAPSAKATRSLLTRQQRDALLKAYNASYDTDHGGWGDVHKLIEAESMELAFVVGAVGSDRARRTLTQNLFLIDPVWGGVYQYSDAADWHSPHFEKLMSYQADDLRLYAEAYERWADPRYLQAANSLCKYIDQYLTAPDGGFYVSQDADVSADITGHDFYARDDRERRKLGMPKVDTHEYARETGWAVRARAQFYDATGDLHALRSAEKGASWALANRALKGGGFRHDRQEDEGPYLDDNVAMVQAFLALYRSTAERAWLTHATDALDFIDRQFRHTVGGFVAAPAASRARGVFKNPVRLVDQNAALTRAANLAQRYTDNPRYREMAVHGMRFLVESAQSRPEQGLPEILLADRELSTAPIHVAIVGSKSDPAAQALHTAALRYPADYLQVDWLDRAEGELPNHEIQYPNLGRAAAFACADGACSSPVFDGSAIDGAVRTALQR